MYTIFGEPIFTSNNGIVDGVASFNGLSTNVGNVLSGATFADTSVNSGTVSGAAVFSDTSVNTGSLGSTVTFTGSSSNTGVVLGSATFADTTINNGVVSGAALFADTSSNVGSLGSTVTFTGSSINTGVVLGEATFTDTTTNASIYIETAIFKGSAINTGTIAVANFEGSASNTGTITLQAVFADTAKNDGGTVQGSVVFSGSAVNTGSVAEAVFIGNSSNNGTVTLSATFADSASNSGSIQGDAIFADTTTNTGSVDGQAQVSPTATNSGTTPSVIEYVHPDGAFVNGYYIGGTKTAPVNYETVVYHIDSFWYKYDSNGVGVLASGDYNDGTGTVCTFAYGVKKVRIIVPDTHWYDDASSAAHAVTLNGTVTQSDEGGGVMVASFDGSTGYLTTNSNNNLNLTGVDSTVELWINLSNLTSYKGILFGSSDGSAGGGLFIGTDSNTIIIGNGFTIFCTFPVNLNTWYHIAISTVNGTQYYFLNGVLQTTSTSGFGNSNYLFIGSYLAYSWYFEGKIAGLRIINGTGLYTSDFTVPTTLLTAVSGTQLLLNFGATAVPHIAQWYDDSSSAAHAVTLNGAVTQSDEGGGVKAANFDGSGYINVDPTGMDDAGTNIDFTLEMFIKTSTLGSTIFEFADLAANGGGTNNTGGLSLAVATVNAFILESSEFLSTDSWDHIAFQNRSGNLEIYRNGRRIATTTSTYNNGVFGNNPKLKFGTNTWSGKIAAINYIVGSALYNGSYAIPTTLPTAVSGTQLLLNFGATAAPSVPMWYDDASSAAHTVAVNGTVTQSDEGGGVKAAAFSSSYLSIADNSAFDFGSGDFTIEAFIKPSSVSGESAIITTAYPTDESGIHLANYNGKGYIIAGDGSWIATTNNPSPVTSFVAGQWTHIAYVRNGNTFTLYVNGVSDVTFTDSTALNNTNNQILVGGRSTAGGQYFNGLITNVRVVKGSALYTSDFSVPTSLPTAVTGTQLLLNFGATAAPTIPTIPPQGTVLSTETNYITINGNQYGNGTYDVIADGNNGSSNGNYQYAPSGTVLYNDGSYNYVSDGSGGYTQEGPFYYISGSLAQNEQYNLQGDGHWHVYVNGSDQGAIPDGECWLSLTGTYYIYYDNGSATYC